MKNSKKLIALLLSVIMILSMFAACSKTDEPVVDVPDNSASTEADTTPTTPEEPEEDDEPEVTVTPDEPEEEDEPAEPAGPATLVYATSTFGQKFSPFFYTTVYDGEVVDMVTLYLLVSDRGGAVIEDGIEGKTVDYNGTDYTYNAAGNVEVVQNDDGTVDYNLTMRDDIVFSDGVPASIDDVIFDIYVRCDPTYDGSSTLYALPIEGMEEYRSGMDSRGNAIFAAGPDNTDFTLWTEDQQKAFFDYYDNESGAAFAQEIVDYCISKGYNAPDDSVAACAANWGFELAEDATVYDFWDTILEAYGGDTDEAESVESAGSTRLGLTIASLGSDFETGVQTGNGAANIVGIQKTGDYSMTIHMTKFDATAIYNMSFAISPLHYYGDKTLYDYDNNQFGFVKGDLSGVKSKNTQPLGAGAFTYEGYANGVVTLKANPTFYKGAPQVEYLLMQESVDTDYVPGIITGTFDIASPSINDATVKAIKDGNANNELVGETLTTILVDYRGYGYLGINADLVNVNDAPASDASKNLRKGFMTLFSVYRDTVINSYYGDRAAVIQYPISNTSWAAPKPADQGYKNAYSTDVNGNPIYDASMNEEQRYEAAKAAAIDYFKAAGFTYDEAAGKFVDVTETYEVMIPGQGQQDHPAYGIAVAASEVLESLGITLQVNDVGTAVWNNALESNTAMMWAAAWQASVDPDMTQVYSSANAHGNGTNSNHYSVDDAALDELIVAGRSSADTEYRKSVYKDAMEIIMDWGCELPLYQRKDCTVASSERIVIDTIPHDMTPYWGWAAEIEKLQVQ